MQVHEEQFDEEWEQCLFKIVWPNRQRNRKSLKSSRLLSEIKDKILSESDAEEFKNLEDCLRMTAVTAVHLHTDDGVFSGANDSEEGVEASNRIDYWIDSSTN